MAGSDIKSYRDLLVWQQAMDFAVRCYQETRRFPRDELYGLTSQIRRSSTSIAANIAEGHGRETSAVFVQFLRVAQGSLKETETHLIMAERLGLSRASDIEPLLTASEELGRMLRSLIRTLQDKQPR